MKKLILQGGFLLASLCFISSLSFSQAVDSSLYNSLQWRSIGPYRGGRTVGAAGVPQQPNVFYIGVNNGGVWKTTDYGRKWFPIFDDQPTGSIGTISVAPSDPDIVYVGSGEGLHRPDLSTGNGIYKSTDAGKTWVHLGLRDGQQIPRIAIDKNNPDRIFVAVLGHPYGPNEERGIFRSTDGGKTFEKALYIDENTGGDDVEIDPGNPDIIYVGSGEGLHRPDLSTGNGIYKSTDAGKTWVHLGLRDGQQIPRIAIDKNNPDRIFVAVLGHPYGPNEERGIFRSTDGGKTFEKALYIDENTGGDDVEIDPGNPDIIFATLWQSREGPWENGQWSGAKGGVFKSTDGGNTWKKLSKDFPANMVQAHIAIAPSSPNIIYVAMGTSESNEYGTGSGMGIYRSDDTGENWKKISEDGRPEARIGGGDVPEIMVDAKNPEKVYSASIVAWRSTDGAKTWTAINGAPGGNDYQNVWINPIDTNIILITGDQGAIITVNGGDTWSSWYNQPTAQLYHVSADNAFPYNLYSGQQESGSVGISSRGNDGQITFRDWHPVAAEEYGYVAADPLNSNIIYGGKISKYIKLNGQAQSITPQPVRNGDYRFVRTEPVIFSPIDPHTLYFAGNVLFKTQNGGESWQVISPDLSRKSWDIPASVGIYANDEQKTMPRRGVIYTVAPSPININTIWAGTDDGYIQLTNDGGKTWKNVTPPAITSWSKLSMIDAGHFNVNTAYAAVNRIRCDDAHPYIYKTNDRGKTWQLIVNGLPDDPINAVREDPKKQGLLYASSETQVYVSFDDGAHWQSLRLNMPATSVRDIIIKDDDLAAATHGRGFWILDNITPLRQLSKNATFQNTLFKPGTATRVRWNLNPDTPLPPDEPAGENPPDGAMIDYYLKEKVKGEVTLDIVDSKGKLIRHFSSNDTLYKIPEVDIPLYWIRPQQILSAEAGPHRFLWDMHYAPLNLPPSYPISAIYKNTAPQATSPWVMPGNYTVKLSVNGETFSQPLVIKMDPRVKTSLPGLLKLHDLALQCYENRKKISRITNEIVNLHNQLTKLSKGAGDEMVTSLDNLDKKISNIKEAAPGSKSESFSRLYNSFATLFNALEESDMRVTSHVAEAVKESEIRLRQLEKNWSQIKSIELPKINAELRKAGRTETIKLVEIKY